MSKDFEKNRDAIIQEFLKGGDKHIETTRKNLDDSYLDDFEPLQVVVHGNNFERAFKTFKVMVQKEKILSVYKYRQSYEKPSVKKRRKQNEMRQKRMEMEVRQAKIDSGEFEKELLKKQKNKELKKKNKEDKLNNPY